MTTPDVLSYDVRIWKTRVYEGKRGDTYTVRWTVAGEEFHDTFATSKLADSFRAKLTTAAREGVPFEVGSGLPQTMARAENRRTWHEHAAAFVDSKWPHASARHRKNIAEALAAVTIAVLPMDRAHEEISLIRIALRTWSFNKAARQGRPVGRAEPPPKLASALRWIADNSPDLQEFKSAQVSPAMSMGPR
jgi:hypothetical protein